jgi:group I intron endonuclease
MVGIYKITNPNNKVYIGQSINIEKRFKQYKRYACKSQPKLYNSFNEYGVNNHLFEIIKKCEIEELNNKERFYQEKYNAIEKGLNCVYTNGNNKKYYNMNKRKYNIINFFNSEIFALLILIIFISLLLFKIYDDKNDDINELKIELKELEKEKEEIKKQKEKLEEQKFKLELKNNELKIYIDVREGNTK